MRRYQIEGFASVGKWVGYKGLCKLLCPRFFSFRIYEELKDYKEQKKTRQPWYAVGAEALYRLHGNKRERARYRGMMSRVVVDGMFVFLYKTQDCNEDAFVQSFGPLVARFSKFMTQRSCEVCYVDPLVCQSAMCAIQ